MLFFFFIIPIFMNYSNAFFFSEKQNTTSLGRDVQHSDNGVTMSENISGTSNDRAENDKSGNNNTRKIEKTVTEENQSNEMKSYKNNNHLENDEDISKTKNEETSNLYGGNFKVKDSIISLEKGELEKILFTIFIVILSAILCYLFKKKYFRNDEQKKTNAKSPKTDETSKSRVYSNYLITDGDGCTTCVRVPDLN